jgi:hypothetical protein
MQRHQFHQLPNGIGEKDIVEKNVHYVWNNLAQLPQYGHYFHRCKRKTGKSGKLAGVSQVIRSRSALDCNDIYWIRFRLVVG